MSRVEALEYVELVIEELYAAGYIPEAKYGTMTVDFQQELAEKLAAKSEE